MKNIVFFNHFHNGDIHVSREFIRKIVDVVRQQRNNATFSYAHKNAHDLLADIKHLTFDPNIRSAATSEHAGIETRGNTTYVNTWYGQQHGKYLNQHGITMDCLYALFDDICNFLCGFGLNGISPRASDFFPTIDYSPFQIARCQSWLASHSQKKVFISNGQALSGQAHNFPMSPIVARLAQQRPDTIFILTNKEAPTVLPNIVYSSDIIGKIGSDLNENAYLSQFCDVIVGRASGPFTFAFTQQNFFQRSPKILCFSNLVPPAGGKFWLGDMLKNEIVYKADILVSNESDVNKIYYIIDSYIS